MQHYRESMNNSRVTLFSNTSDCNYCYVDLSKAELPILLISTFFFNSVALIILFKIRKKSDEVNHFLVTTIAGNDFGSTVIFMIMWIGGWIKCGCMLTSVTCAILGWFGTAAVVWSAWIVIVTSVIRYLATVKPLYYRAHITPTKVHIATYATLVFTLLQLAFPFFGAAAPYKYYEDNFICAYDFSPGSFSKSHRVILGFLSVEGLLASASTMYLNFSIVYEMRKKNAISHNDTYNKGSTIKETKNAFANVTTVISVVFCICYVPFLTRLLYDVIITNVESQDEFYHSLTMSLLFLAPLLNPIVYVICNKRYRSYLAISFKIVFTKLKCQRRKKVIDFTDGTNDNHITPDTVTTIL